ncbi:MAG TPA: hypothetical protein VL547_13350 [Dinghuibacter sp.]|jgi:hypothetical protein|uniref:hypothetical protein n=1 Tax=Dinghuibacter sp. TaxID=2024697 RepID=UPI002BE6F4E9|nr:hypothetical protein [Dinghuibacter sp.]HTJ13015.1 hypothetical protein [Dinghuibacter sp.]
MKKIGFGILAVALAVAGSAFTAPKKDLNNVYYFPLNNLGQPQSISTLPQTENPFSCPGRATPCSAGYATYVQNPDNSYSATGTMVSGTEEYVGD